MPINKIVIIMPFNLAPVLSLVLFMLSLDGVYFTWTFLLLKNSTFRRDNRTRRQRWRTVESHVRVWEESDRTTTAIHIPNRAIDLWRRRRVRWKKIGRTARRRDNEHKKFNGRAMITRILEAVALSPVTSMVFCFVGQWKRLSSITVVKKRKKKKKK